MKRSDMVLLISAKLQKQMHLINSEKQRKYPKMLCDNLALRVMTAIEKAGMKPPSPFTSTLAKALGLPVNLFMINGIQTAKTKIEFARQVTARSEEDFTELKNAVVFQARKWIESNEANMFPQTAPGPCSNYGGCTYRRICEVPNKLKETIIQAEYGPK